MNNNVTPDEEELAAKCSGQRKSGTEHRSYVKCAWVCLYSYRINGVRFQRQGLGIPQQGFRLGWLVRRSMNFTQSATSLVLEYRTSATRTCTVSSLASTLKLHRYLGQHAPAHIG